MPEMKLLEIQERFLQLNEALSESNGEITPENEAYFDEVFKDFAENEKLEAEKVDGYCTFLASLDMRVAALKEREEIFRMDRKVTERKIENLRDRLKEYGLTTGRLTCSEAVEGQKKKIPGKKIETVPHGYKVSVQYAGTAKLFVDEKANIPDDYLIYKEPEINRKKIAEDLNNGVSLSWAHFEERTIALVIK